MLLYCSEHVFRTGWYISTVGWNKRTEKTLVGPDDSKDARFQRVAHFNAIRAQCLSRLLRNSALSAERQFEVGKTTISTPVSFSSALKDSRTMRLTRLRSTAFLIFFFATAMPRRGLSPLFGRNNKVQYLSALRWLFLNTRANCSEVSSRASRPKQRSGC